MKQFKVSVTLFYLLIISYICMAKFLRKSIPRRRKGSNSSSSGALEARIIGGRPTHPGEFPYQIQMQIDIDSEEYHVCGATLVIAPATGKQIVITAAHCINEAIIEAYTIRAGSIYIDGSDFQTLTIKKAVVHPNYDENLLLNDLAILFLDGEFQLNKSVQPLELPRANENVKKEITVTGWGKVGSSDYDSLSKRLQALRMPIVPNRKCNDLWKKRTGLSDNFIVPTHLCAGNLKGDQSSCNGDSGGPAMAVDKNGRKFLAGVVSFGHYGCSTKGFPAVFTRVSKFVKWIDEVSNEFENER